MLHSPGGAAPDVATIQMRIAEMEQELARGPNQEHALVVPNPRHAAQLQERIAWARQVAQTPPISPEEARAARLTRDATRAAEAAGLGITSFGELQKQEARLQFLGLGFVRGTHGRTP